MTKLVTPLPSNRAAATSASPPPVGGSLPPTAWAAEEIVIPLAVAVADGVRGGPVWTVTSGLAVTLGVGLGASTHLVTLWPLAAAVVVQKEPCAEAPGASIRTAIKDNEVNSNTFLTDAPPPGGWL
jgi:hypothetical protein